MSNTLTHRAVNTAAPSLAPIYESVVAHLGYRPTAGLTSLRVWMIAQMLGLRSIEVLRALPGAKSASSLVDVHRADMVMNALSDGTRRLVSRRGHYWVAETAPDPGNNVLRHCNVVGHPGWFIVLADLTPGAPWGHRRYRVADINTGHTHEVRLADMGNLA